ncbi:hypothetical protein, partial [Bradyrhizobium sp.]|uniref:hypothetical protein n=1 Tax=Bradyrhizobium sp. TaxID=376 RepID=UPI0025C1E749
REGISRPAATKLRAHDPMFRFANLDPRAFSNRGYCETHSKDEHRRGRALDRTELRPGFIRKHFAKL